MSNKEKLGAALSTLAFLVIAGFMGKILLPLNMMKDWEGIVLFSILTIGFGSIFAAATYCTITDRN